MIAACPTPVRASQLLIPLGSQSPCLCEDALLDFPLDVLRERRGFFMARRRTVDLDVCALGITLPAYLVPINNANLAMCSRV